jgi:hypothetical protein
MCDGYTLIKKKAAFRLGIIYFLGDGTKPFDFDKALCYFQYAKELGSKKAATFLAKFDEIIGHSRPQEVTSTVTTTANILEQLGGTDKRSEPAVVVTEALEQPKSSLERDVASSMEEHEQSTTSEAEESGPSSLFNYCSIL